METGAYTSQSWKRQVPWKPIVEVARLKADLVSWKLCNVSCKVLETRWQQEGAGSHSFSSTLQGQAVAWLGAWASTPCSKISPEEKEPHSILHSDLYPPCPARDLAGGHTPVTSEELSARHEARGGKASVKLVRMRVRGNACSHLRHGHFSKMTFTTRL